MTSKLKVLGLALVAVFAMSAIAASAAQAEPTLTSEVSPVTLEAKAGGYGSGEVLKVFGEEIECENSAFHMALTLTPEKEITMEPSYGPKCQTTSAQHFPMTVTMNGCTYRFYNLKFNATAKDYGSTVDLKCPGSTVIEIHIYATTATHSEKITLCTMTVPPQKELEKATITTSTTAGQNYGDLKIEGTIKIKEIVEHRNSILCPKGPGSTVTEEGEEIVSASNPITVTGTTETGGENDIDISGE